jgi:hypothetical protein
VVDRYCGNCGNALAEDDLFCPKCGKPVHGTARVATPEADVPTPPPPSAAGPAAASATARSGRGCVEWGQDRLRHVHSAPDTHSDRLYRAACDHRIVVAVDPIHPPSGKRCSRKFVGTEFSEVTQLTWCPVAHTFLHRGVRYSHYVRSERRVRRRTATCPPPRSGAATRPTT